MQSSKTFKAGDLVRYQGLPYLLEFNSSYGIVADCSIVGTNRSCCVLVRGLELDKNAMVTRMLNDL